MAWYDTTHKDNDIVFSSRVRFARNIENFPYAEKMSKEQAINIIDNVSSILKEKDLDRFDFLDISPLLAESFVEKHLVSADFTKNKLPHSLLLDKKREVSIMLCEEDHIRLQAILPGLNIRAAYEAACEIDDLLDQSLEIAFDQHLGYLTHCPTNLGTGMRASVMLFLPALTMSDKIGLISTQLSKLGLTVRGLYGEGSRADGFIYQISNQVTLGITEEDTLKKLEEIINQIIEQERAIRNSINQNSPDYVTDRVMRAEGILRSAYLLSTKEFLTLAADVRLGISLGIIKHIDFATISRLLVEAMPASLLLNNSDDAKSNDSLIRDKLRAKYVREILNSFTSSKI